MLTALVEMERECAAACASGADWLEERHLRGELLDLHSDHLRHLDVLGRLIVERSGQSASTGPSAPGAGSPEPLAAKSEATPRRVFASLLRRETMVAGAYENALLHPWDRPSRSVLDANAWEQQRHLRLLEARTRALAPAGPKPGRPGKHEPVHFRD